MNGKSSVSAQCKKLVPVYGHPNLSRPENHPADLRPIGHKGAIQSNQCLQHLRFAVTRIESAIEDSRCADGSNFLGAWSGDLEKAIELVEAAIKGQKAPNKKLVPRTGGWVKREVAAA